MPGPSLEAIALLATLVHHVPGLRVGHAVLANTFRHPAVLAKSATVLDHATGGRFVLGLGAGWFEGEHEPFGIDLPPIGERIDRLISAVEVLRAAVLAGGRDARGRHARRPLLPAARGDQPAGAADAGRPAALPRRAEAARHPARGPARRRLAAHRDRGGRRRVLRGPPRRAPARARGRGARPGRVRVRRAGPHRARRRGPHAGARPGTRHGRRRRDGDRDRRAGGLGPAALEAAHRDVLGPLRAEHG